MSAPQRIQLSRRKGWRMPDNTVSVARPTKWGNPWTVKDYMEAGYRPTHDEAVRVCVEAFEAWMKREQYWAHGTGTHPPPDATELRGKNLACWCPLDQPCHADVLLELANKEPE